MNILFKKDSDLYLIIRFWKYIAPHKLLFLTGLILLPLVTLAQLSQPFILKVIIDNVIIGDNYKLLPLYTFLMGLAVLLQLLFTFLQYSTLQTLGQKALKILRQDIVDHIFTRSSSFFDKYKVGQLVTRVTNDVESLSELFSSGLVSLIGDIITLSAIIIAMLLLDTRLALVTILIIPIIALGSTFFRKRIFKAFQEIRKAISQINSFLAEHIAGISIIHLFNREKRTLEEFSEINKRHYKAHLSSVFHDSALYAFVEMLASITLGILVWMASGNLLSGLLSFGSLVAFFNLIQKFFHPLRDLYSKYSIIKTSTVALERIYVILDDKSEIPEAKPPKPIHNPAGEVIFENVTFGYDPDFPIIKNLNFQIRPGEKVAIVGATGSGKTTIIKLLIRLYDIQKGSIKLDGIDIRDHSLEALRSTIGAVHQDLFIFKDTIANNISLNEESLLEEELERYSQIVSAHHFIENLPNRYNQQIMEGGKNLSLGQKQLICFARALAYNPKVLILDEATGSIDTHHEIIIQNALKNLLQNRTSIIIAHRLSTIRNADRILVMHKGAIREEGSHDSLIKKNGIYHHLCELQFGV